MMDYDPIRRVKVNASFTYRLGDQIKSEGNHGTLVFKGFFNDMIPIALKRYQKVDENAIKDVQRDLDILASPNNRHPNYIRYYGHSTDDNFSYLATELCECSVADIIDPKRKIKVQDKTIYFEAIVASLPKKEILRQSSEAVNFLHRPQWNMIHRNLHPDNFLIACVDPTKDYFLIKLTDFQLSKSIEKNPQNTGTLNKEGWVASENFKDNIELDNKVDAFILGCYYFYVLSGGEHPFGRGVVNQRTRIKDINDRVYQASWDGKPEWNTDQATVNEKEEAEWALKMIKGLIKYNPNDRKSVDDVLRSKYFQPEPYVIYEHSTSLKAGLCVILTQSKYHNDTMDIGNFSNQGAPEGIEIDSKNLENTFFHFGYQVLHFKNLRAREIVHFLSPDSLAEHSNVSSLDEFASLIVCVLGHGDKDTVMGVDGTPVRLNRLQYAFNDVLRDKPKIFIILSCRGDQDQLILERNDPLFSPPTVTTLTMRASARTDRMPPLIDFLSLMSTIEEFQTVINPKIGSEFINALCDALRHEYNVDDPSKKMDLVQLFSAVVIPRVGRSEIRKKLPQSNGPDLIYIIKQTPESRSSLTKAIRFRCTPAPGAAKLIYDGERDDPCFLIGREYFRNLLLGYPIWQTSESRSALSKKMTEFRRFETLDTEKVYPEEGETDNPINVYRESSFSGTKDPNLKAEALDESTTVNSSESIESQTMSMTSAMNHRRDEYGATSFKMEKQAFLKMPMLPSQLVSTTPSKTATEDWISIKNIRYDREKKLGEASGIYVFQGYFGDDQPAAIKRFQNDSKIDIQLVDREAKLMKKANGHANILRYFDYEMDSNFLYLATELCIGTLQQLVEGEVKNALSISSFFKNENEILSQVTKGLAHLHSLSIIHKDVKPSNLLIYQPLGKKAVMKVADFGISKELKPEQEDATNSNRSNPSGTRGWISPEQYIKGHRYSCKVDIFALGLVFGFTLSDGGKHPYDEGNRRDNNNRAVLISKKSPMILTEKDLKINYLGDGLSFELIQSMLNINPVRRPTAQAILKNALFSDFK